MSSRSLIRHPGPESPARVVAARGQVSVHCVTLGAGQSLLGAVAPLMDRFECDSAVMILDGIDIGPFDYVMPSHSNDGLHAAWYSATHACQFATLQHATAIIGRRDGQWWLHCHAQWHADNAIGLGHLLPDSVILASDATVTFHAFNGGYFDVAFDVETAFPLFHVHGDEREQGNALIAKVYPHEDIFTAVESLIAQAGFSRARIFGIGSLIGARFEQGRPMQCPVSEVLIAPEAQWNGDLLLPVYCVDTDNNHFQGTLLQDAAPVLVTFELMIIDAAGLASVLGKRG